jgi:hypothetical protein
MAAKSKSSSLVKTFIPKPRKKRKGIVSKNKSSRIKGSKNYLKRYRGQGK